eukprot:COSAG05_NODE_994_length_6264_cov_3.618329_6_plen_205_part_00
MDMKVKQAAIDEAAAAKRAKEEEATTAQMQLQQKQMMLMMQKRKQMIVQQQRQQQQLQQLQQQPQPLPQNARAPPQIGTGSLSPGTAMGMGIGIGMGMGSSSAASVASTNSSVFTDMSAEQKVADNTASSPGNLSPSSTETRANDTGDDEPEPEQDLSQIDPSTPDGAEEYIRGDESPNWEAKRLQAGVLRMRHEQLPCLWKQK